MLNMRDMFEFARETGLPISGAGTLADGMMSQRMEIGDHYLYLDGLRRNRCWTLQQTIEAQEATDFSVDELEDFSNRYEDFKERINKYDFTDQLEIFYRALDRWHPPLTHLFVDECQDLSTLQWKIVNKLHGKIGTSVYAGDDKQAIYGFSGGDTQALIDLEGERIILEESYRLPKTILAYSESIASNIREKQPYTVSSRQEEGSVEYINNLFLLEEQMKEGTWFLLVRNRKMMSTFEVQLNKMGFLYLSDSANSLITEEVLHVIETWSQMIKGFTISGKDAKLIYSKYLRGKSVAHGFKKQLLLVEDDESLDRGTLRDQFGLLKTDEWYDSLSFSEALREALMLLKEKGELGSKPRIRVSTIHAVKGKEADNVVVLPDMSVLTHRAFQKNPDDEHRVFYVAVTRAKQNLYLHSPTENRHYPL
jgi:superfamily I DNA/RNA helicase